jgi:hypothetical protein
VLILFLPAHSRAEGICPWLNQATASGFLGGPASSLVENGSPGEATCAFHYQKGNTRYDLQIKVERMKGSSIDFGPYKALCGSDSVPLRAIGNEALLCSLQRKGEGMVHGEQVVGRVRDRAFIVSVSTNAGDDPSMSMEVLKEKVSDIAEQVAGALF